MIKFSSLMSRSKMSRQSTQRKLGFHPSFCSRWFREDARIMRPQEAFRIWGTSWNGRAHHASSALHTRIADRYTSREHRQHQPETVHPCPCLCLYPYLFLFLLLFHCLHPHLYLHLQPLSFFNPHTSSIQFCHRPWTLQ